MKKFLVICFWCCLYGMTKKDVLELPVFVHSSIETIVDGHALYPGLLYYKNDVYQIVIQSSHYLPVDSSSLTTTLKVRGEDTLLQIKRRIIPLPLYRIFVDMCFDWEPKVREKRMKRYELISLDGCLRMYLLQNIFSLTRGGGSFNKLVYSPSYSRS